MNEKMTQQNRSYKFNPISLGGRSENTSCSDGAALAAPTPPKKESDNGLGATSVVTGQTL